MFESFKYRKRLFETDEQRFQREEWERKRFFKSLLVLPPMICVVAFLTIMPKPDLNPYEETTGKIIEKRIVEYEPQINIVEYEVNDQTYTVEIEGRTNAETMIIYYHEDNPEDANNDFGRKYYEDQDLRNKLVFMPCVIIFILVAVIEYILLFFYRKRKKELDKAVLTEYTADQIRDKYLKKGGYVYQQKKKNYGDMNYQYNVKTHTNINGETKTEEYAGVANTPAEAQAIMNEIIDKVNDKLDDGIENNSNKM